MNCQKPGLVDAYSNGAHKDMTLLTFFKSADTITPYLEEMAKVGTLLTSLLWEQIGHTYAMLIGFLAVLIIRIQAARRGWNLPKIRQTRTGM